MTNKVHEEKEQQEDKATKKTEEKAEETQNKAEEKNEEKKDEKAAQEDKKGSKNKKKKTKKETAEDKIQELGEQVEKLNDKHLRLQAEFDNYRKRTMKERIEMLKNAGEDVLKDMLPVVDDMDRAITNINDAKDMQAVKDGMKLIDQKMKDFIKQKGLSEIEAMHSDFDTDLHEAITKIPAPEEKLKGKVVDVIQKGYKLNDKVIRFAKVVIGE